MALAAFGILTACYNSNRQQQPVTVVEEDVVIAETPAASRPVNMRDSLMMEEGKGTVIERKYHGLLPGADVPGIEYDLTLFFQQDSDNGVYALNMTYLEAEDGEDMTFPSYGKRKVMTGIPDDSRAIVYRLEPNDGSDIMNFQLMQNGDLTLLDDDMKKIDTPFNYTLKREH